MLPKVPNVGFIAVRKNNLAQANSTQHSALNEVGAYNEVSSYQVDQTQPNNQTVLDAFQLLSILKPGEEGNYTLSDDAELDLNNGSIQIDGTCYRLPPTIRDCFIQGSTISTAALCWIVSAAATIHGSAEFRTKVRTALSNGAFINDPNMPSAKFLHASIEALRAGVDIEYLPASMPIQARPPIDGFAPQPTVIVRVPDDNDAFATNAGSFLRMAMWNVIFKRYSNYPIEAFGDLRIIFDKAQRVFSKATYEYIRDHHQILEIVDTKGIEDHLVKAGYSPETPVRLISIDSHSDMGKDLNEDRGPELHEINIGNWVNYAIRNWKNISDVKWIIAPEVWATLGYAEKHFGFRPGFFVLDPKTGGRELLSTEEAEEFLMAPLTIDEDILQKEAGAGEYPIEQHRKDENERISIAHRKFIQTGFYTFGLEDVTIKPRRTLSYFGEVPSARLHQGATWAMYKGGLMPGASNPAARPLRFSKAEGPAVMTTDLDYFASNRPIQKWEPDHLERYLDALLGSGVEPLYHIVCDSPGYLPYINQNTYYSEELHDAVLDRQAIRFINSIFAIFNADDSVLNDKQLASTFSHQNWQQNARGVSQSRSLYTDQDLPRDSLEAKASWLASFATWVAPNIEKELVTGTQVRTELERLLSQFAQEDLTDGFSISAGPMWNPQDFENQMQHAWSTQQPSRHQWIKWLREGTFDAKRQSKIVSLQALLYDIDQSKSPTFEHLSKAHELLTRLRNEPQNAGDTDKNTVLQVANALYWWIRTQTPDRTIETQLERAYAELLKTDQMSPFILETERSWKQLIGCAKDHPHFLPYETRGDWGEPTLGEVQRRQRYLKLFSQFQERIKSTTIRRARHTAVEITEAFEKNSVTPKQLASLYGLDLNLRSDEFKKTQAYTDLNSIAQNNMPHPRPVIDHFNTLFPAEALNKASERAKIFYRMTQLYNQKELATDELYELYDMKKREHPIAGLKHDLFLWARYTDFIIDPRQLKMVLQRPFEEDLERLKLKYPPKDLEKLNAAAHYFKLTKQAYLETPTDLDDSESELNKLRDRLDLRALENAGGVTAAFIRAASCIESAYTLNIQI